MTKKVILILKVSILKSSSAFQYLLWVLSVLKFFFILNDDVLDLKAEKFKFLNGLIGSSLSKESYEGIKQPVGSASIWAVSELALIFSLNQNLIMFPLIKERLKCSLTFQPQFPFSFTIQYVP